MQGSHDRYIALLYYGMMLSGFRLSEGERALERKVKKAPGGKAEGSRR